MDWQETKMHAMDWEKMEACTMPCFVSGRYQCIAYGHGDRKRWYAFFKPVRWNNRGSCCEVNERGATATYGTLEEAQAACARHLERFGGEPGAKDFITVENTRK